MYIVYERPGLTHAIYAVSRFGESYAPPGVVHLWEHMLERPPEAMAARIERDGGVFDAETAFDYTSISAWLPGPSKRDSFKYFEELLELPSYWEEEDLEKEREAVLIEESRRLSEPSTLVATKLFKRMYGNNPLGREYSDIEKSLYNITLDDLARLHEEAWGDSFFVVVGEVDELPEIPFRPWKRLEKKVYRPIGKPGIEEFSKELDNNAYIAIAADIYQAGPIAVLAERYLAAHADSILYSRLRLLEGTIYDIVAQAYFMRGLEVFVIDFESSKDRVYRNVEIVEKELERMADGEIDREVFEYSKRNLLGSLYRAYDELTSIASCIIRNELYREDPFWELREGKKLIEEFSQEDLASFADRYLRPEKLYVEILLPKRVEIGSRNFLMILGLSKNTKVLVQGITGRQGSFHTKLMLEYGTNIVAGVTPGKGGMNVHGVPVYNTVKEAVEETGAEASVIFVPAKFAKDAVLEAIYAGLSPVVVITEHIPEWDTLYFTRLAKLHGVKLVGPNCPGVIVPGETKLGIMPGYVYTKGPVGIVSKSGTLSYEVAWRLTTNNIGQSGMIGIGGDKVRGMNMLEAALEFENDPNTKAIVVIGEIGGNDEEMLAKAIKEGIITKPVVAFIAGITAPPGKKMGHAGAIVTGSSGTAQAKQEAFRKVGALVATYLHEIPELVKEVL